MVPTGGGEYPSCAAALAPAKIMSDPKLDTRSNVPVSHTFHGPMRPHLPVSPVIISEGGIFISLNQQRAKQVSCIHNKGVVSLPHPHIPEFSPNRRNLIRDPGSSLR